MATSYGHMPASYDAPSTDASGAWAAYNNSNLGYGAASYGYGAYPQAYQYDASAYQQGAYAGSWGVEQAHTTAAPQDPEPQPPIPGTDGQKLAPQPSDGPEQPPLPEDPASTAADTTTAGTPSAPAATTTAAAYDPALYQQWYAYYGQAYGASPQAAGAGYGSYPQSAPAADATTAASYASYAQQAAAGAAYAQAQAGAAAVAGAFGSYQQPTSYGAYSQHTDTNAASQAHTTSQQHSMGATTNGPTSTPSSFQARPPGPRPPPGDPPASSMQRQNSTSYNAVPPPKTNTGYNRVPPGVIRPQYNVRPAAGPSYASAASAAAVPRPPAVIPAPTPAFVRAGTATQPKVATVAAKPTAGASGAKFPPTFNAWVERCFERCRSDAERQAMTGRLTLRIRSAEQGGNVWLVDWDKEPIPDITAPITDGPPTPTGAGQGLRSKRSRWEDSPANQQQNQQQNHQQWGNKKQQNGVKKQQPDNKKQKQQQNYDSPVWSRAEINKRAQRAGRFGDGRVGNGGGGYGGYDSDDTWGSEDEAVVGGVVVQGTSTDLEKSYFRLTGPPDPKEVRPPPVLKRALDRLVRMMRNGTATPFYAVDQFKGMRQDCTVQHLRNELAAAVYEAHGRASLEYGDLAEFNQCQTQLAAMYAEGVPGCVAEFNAYKLLYNLTHARSGANKALIHTLRVALTSQSAPAAAGSAAVTAVLAADPQRAMANALAARAAAAAGNYPGFFTAYAAAPNLGRAILDVLVPHVRWAALNVLVKAYKTSLPLTFVGQALGFIATKAAKAAAAQLAESQASAAGSEEQVMMAGCREPVYLGKAAAAATEEEGVAACARWLEAHGAVLEPTGDAGVPMLDVKASVGKLFIPEEPKVAHGDDNLSLEDFLSRASGLAV